MEVFYLYSSGTQFLCIGQKLLSKLRKPNLTADPVKQRDSQILLELRDLCTDIGLCVSELLRGLSEVF